MNPLKLELKLYLEAEDISQSRIMSCRSFMSQQIKSSVNPYIRKLNMEDECDMDDFIVRLYFDEAIEEEECTSEESAKGFIDDVVDLLSEIAHMQSFLEMEGNFMVEYQDLKKSYKFHSESGDSYCDFDEM